MKMCQQSFEKDIHSSFQLLQIVRLPAPYDTQCAETELPMIDPNREYTRGLCVMNCVLKRLYEECGCIGEHFKRLVNNTGKG